MEMLTVAQEMESAMEATMKVMATAQEMAMATQEVEMVSTTETEIKDPTTAVVSHLDKVLPKYVLINNK